MAVDITALYCCLDDFCKVLADWEAHRLLPSEQARQRSGKLSRAEMLFIVVLFHLSPYKNFKVFCRYGIGGQYRHLVAWIWQESSRIRHLWHLVAWIWQESSRIR